VAYGVGRLVLPSFRPEIAQRPFPEPAKAFARAMETLCDAAVIEIAYVEEPVRKAHRGAARKLLPHGSGTEAARDAMALVLADMAPAAPAPGPVTRLVAALQALPPEEPAGDIAIAPQPPPAPQAPAPTEVPTCAHCGACLNGGGHHGVLSGGDHGVTEWCPNDPRKPPAPAPPEAPRVAGIDPGERWIAVCVGAATDIPSAPLAYVASLQVEIERTGKEQPTDEQLDAAVGRAVDFCELHGVERAAVERAVNVHRAPGKSAAEGAGLAAYLLRGQYVAGMLRGALRAARNEGGSALVAGRVEGVSSVKGRNHVRRLAGLGIGKDIPWQPAARAAFGGTIPPGVGEHVLDAAVAAVWATRPEEAPAAPAPPRAPREPGAPRVSKHASRKAQQAAARVAAGCVCPGARHTLPDCPIRQAANEARAVAMVGNANRKKSTVGPVDGA